MESLLSLPCYSKESVKELVLREPQKNSDIQDNGITKTLQQFKREGAEALKTRKSGPKGNYRRTDEVVRQIIRYRFLDPQISPEVIAQKLVQCGYPIAVRSVEQVISEYGLQKKLRTCHPGKPPIKIETHRTKQKVRLELCDSQSIERGVRQLLADKLTAEGIQPTIPWLYDFKLDFRFK